MKQDICKKPAVYLFNGFFTAAERQIDATVSILGLPVLFSLSAPKRRRAADEECPSRVRRQQRRILFRSAHLVPFKPQVAKVFSSLSPS